MLYIIYYIFINSDNIVLKYIDFEFMLYFGYLNSD